MKNALDFAPNSHGLYYYLSYDPKEYSYYDKFHIGRITYQLFNRGVRICYYNGTSQNERDQEIVEIIKNCSEVIVFLSSHLMKQKNPHIKNEIRVAKQLNKKINVVLIDEINPRKVKTYNLGWFTDIEDNSLFHVIKYNYDPPESMADQMIQNFHLDTNADDHTLTKKSKFLTTFRNPLLFLAFELICIVVLLLFFQNPITSINNSLTRNKYYYTEYNDNITITGRKDKKMKELILPDKINSKSVTVIGKKAFYMETGINKVVIPDSVNEIESSAFYWCWNLSEVVLPDSIKKIGPNVFYGCKRLKKINIPTSVTVLSDGVFYECESLNNVIIPDSVTTIQSDVFFDCESLTEIYIPDSVNVIGNGAFAKCYNLKNIRLSDSINIIDDYTFINCDKLNTVDIPQNVTRIGKSAFFNCSKLTHISIPDSVTSIGEMAFAYCDSLYKIEIPDSVNDMGYGIFHDCPNLTIYGTSGSYAESYANYYHIAFVVQQGAN